MATSSRGRHGRVLRSSERVYRSLLRAYPRGLRDEYGDEMVLCFRDLCSEELEHRGRRGLTALWAHTLTELIYTALRERRSTLARNTYQSIFGVAIVTALILLIPLLTAPAWTPGDFVRAGALLFGTGLAFVLVVRGGGNFAYRSAVGVALAAALFLAWVNLSVGIIGQPNEGANLMYMGVLAVGMGGVFVARLRPQEMARALLATSLAQALVAVIALTFGLGAGSPPGVLGLLILNGFFVLLFAGSALLFRYAGRERTPAGASPGV